MADADLNTSDPTRLSQMLAVDGGTGSWRPEEMGAILRHQLSARVDADLPPEEGESPVWRMTFAELLHHPHPPVEMLTRVKRFAKACTLASNGPLPRDVATVLYFASIVVARLRYGQRITELDDPALRRGTEWARAQAWVDPATRSIFDEAIAQWPATE